MTLAFASERIEQWPLSRLQPYAKNAKAHGPDQVAKIAASMAKFGWTVPCLVAEDGELKDGATVINYDTEFNITPAAEVDFDLDNATPASGALRKRCQAMIESVEDSLGGLAAGQVQLRAECG